MNKKIILPLAIASLCISTAPVLAEDADITARLEEVNTQIEELKAERRDLLHQLDDQPVYEDDYIRVWFDKVGEPSYDWYSVGIYFTIENKKETSIEVSADELSVDGFMIKESFIDDISPNKKVRSVINIEDTSFTTDNTKDIELKIVYREKESFDFIRTEVFDLD